MSALDVIQTGSFTVKRRIGNTAFEFSLPNHLKIHPLIFCVHLEPAQNDPHSSKSPPPALIIVGGEERYLIGRILIKEQRQQPSDRRRRTHHRARWQGYGPQDDPWIAVAEVRTPVLEMLEQFDRFSNSYLPRTTRSYFALFRFGLVFVSCLHHLGALSCHAFELGIRSLLQRSHRGSA